MAERLNIPQLVGDFLLDMAHRPLGIKRKRVGNQIVYTAKKLSQPIKTTIVETDSSIVVTDTYKEKESDKT